MTKPLPNVEFRGLVHRQLPGKSTTSRLLEYRLACGKYLRIHNSTHYDTDAIITCLACVANTEDKPDGT